jgi:hypothetical protein
MKEMIQTKAIGLVQVFDETGALLLEKHNDIHARNMAIAIARGLSNSGNNQIFKIKLGNQGTYIDGSQQIVFRSPNVVSPTASLYNATYQEVVDDQHQSVDAGNSVTFTTIPGTSNTRVIVTATVSANQAVNNPTDTNGASPGQIGGIASTNDPYFFDELGLFTPGPTEQDELMLSHLIFSPIEHTGNRELTIVYSITISVS